MLSVNIFNKTDLILKVFPNHFYASIERALTWSCFKLDYSIKNKFFIIFYYKFLL